MAGFRVWAWAWAWAWAGPLRFFALLRLSIRGLGFGVWAWTLTGPLRF